MIANARMYGVSPEVSDLWRSLLAALIERTGLPIAWVEHAAPAPIDALWRRDDKAAVFMCGLPFSLAQPRPVLVAAPVPSPTEFGGKPLYWSDLVVREDSPYRGIEQTFGRRIAFTLPSSQSGYLAALHYFMGLGGPSPLFQEIIAPQLTPLGAITAVIGGNVELAPIDSYAFRLLQKYRSDLTSQLRVIARTVPTPIPAFVASPGVLSPQELESLQTAFLEAHQLAPTKPLMAKLLLQCFVRAEAASYDVLRDNCEAVNRYFSAPSLASVTHPAFTG